MFSYQLWFIHQAIDLSVTCEYRGKLFISGLLSIDQSFPIATFEWSQQSWTVLADPSI